MKKFILLGLLSMMSMVGAYEYDAPEEAQAFALEVRGAIFYPESSRIKKVYDKRLYDYELVASKLFCDQGETYLGVGLIHKRGHSLGRKDKTNMRYIPISCGLKYYIPIASRLDFYLGGGVLVGYLHFHDHSKHLRHQNRSKWAFGGIANIGFKLYATENIFFDLFGDYQYQEFHFKHSSHQVRSSSCNLSGFRYGIGIGFSI